MKYYPTAKGYFSGAGGMEIGLMQAGIRVIQSLDIDADALRAMSDNPAYFSHHVLSVDIKDMKVLDQPKSDIIVGTYPCTKYSAIADLHGTRTGDDLFLHFFRHIAIEKPEMYIVENVPGMRKFPIVMEAMTKLPDYYVHVFCPVDAVNWLPQRRERLILIGTRKPYLIMAPASTRKLQLRQIIESDPEFDMPDYIANRLSGKYRDRPIIIDPDEPGVIAPTCIAHYAKDLSTRLIKDAKIPGGFRPFTIREYARLQGFPDDFKFQKKRSSYRLIGNAVPVPLGRWIGQEAMKYFN